MSPLRRRPRFALIITGTLCLGLMTAPPTAGAGEEQPSPDGRSSLENAADDARVSGKRVEDEEQRTESTSVFANPDGTVTHRDFGGPVRIERGGEWVDVNYDLTELSDGSYAPTAAPVDVRIGAGPADEAARVNFGDGRAMAITWPTDLPAPSVDGGVATYALSETTDLVVAVTSEGLNAHLRLNEPPALEDPVFTFGLRTKGVEVEENSDGALTVTSVEGEIVGGSTTLVAWDAGTDPAGEPTNVVPLDAELSPAGRTGSAADQDLELTAPRGFLSDPDTEYPVTIDPDIKVTSSPRDIWVRDGVTEGQGSDPTLRVGKMYNHSNTKPARSYLQFNTPSLFKTRNDVQVIDSELGLWQYYGFTCSNKRMNVHPTRDAWSGDITWPNRPVSHLQDQYYSWISSNRGASSCARDWSKINVTKIAKAWFETREIANNGFTLLAFDETHHDHERRFCSKENNSSHAYCNSAARRPYLDVTYSVAPNAPGTPTATTAATEGGTRTTVGATVTDPLDGTVRARLLIKRGGTTVFDGYTSYVSSGGRATLALANLSPATYVVQAWANNGSRSSAASTTASFTVPSSPGSGGEDESLPELEDAHPAVDDSEFPYDPQESTDDHEQPGPLVLEDLLIDDSVPAEPTDPGALCASDDCEPRVTAGIASQQLVALSAYVLPATTDDPLIESQEREFFKIDPDNVRMEGSSFEILLEPGEVPAAYVGADGLIDVSVRAETAAGTEVGFTFAQMVSDDGSGPATHWSDPNLMAVQEDVNLDAGPGTQASATASWEEQDGVVLTDLTPVEFPEESVSTARSAATSSPDHDWVCREKHDATRVVRVTAATSYPSNGGRAAFKITKSNGGNYGIAMKVGDRAWFQSSKTFRKSGGWTAQGPSAKVARAHRIEVEYKRFKVSCQNGAGKKRTDYEWRPSTETGGADAVGGIERPNWNTKCARLGYDYSWGRNDSNGKSYSLGTGVKLKQVIGLDIGVTRNYSTTTQLRYRTPKATAVKLCGNNDYPSKAGKIMMRKR